MKRKIDKYLEEWKRNPAHKPLIVKGARQTGKTESILHFAEFLWAKGYTDNQIYSILEHMVTQEPFSELEMQVLKSLFLDYCVLGGMPDVVKQYIETGTFSESLDIQRQIMLDYEEDVRKYAQGLDQAWRKIFL